MPECLFSYTVGSYHSNSCDYHTPMSLIRH
jgi:hypothetical protein